MNLIDHHYESDCHHHKSNCHHHDQELRTEADLEMIGNKKAKEVKTIRDLVASIWVLCSSVLCIENAWQVIFKEDDQLVETRLQQVFQVR